MTNEFIKGTQAQVMDGAVRFTAFVAGGEPRVFDVSGEALVQHFGAKSASDADLLDAFENGRARLLAAASKALNTPEAEGAIALGSGDF
jgi:hypothetical protein